ncbi:MAG: tetratricopeptide repeat protein [Deltaproteobacteria bacterium]|nr:MAG: tetratricopeptide repeat protein [Deltaproteobacteria bacterium]
MRASPPFAALALAVCALWSVACGSPPLEERFTDIQQMLAQSRFDDAIEELREILDTDPENARANFMLAIAFQRTNQPTLAVWPLEKAFNDAEYQIRAGLQLANLHLGLLNPTNAARVATRLIEIAPENVEAHRLRGRAYLADKRFDEALADAAWLIETDPTSAIGLVLKGSIYSDMQRYDEAEGAFRQAIELTAEDPADNERVWVVLTSFLAENIDDADRAEAGFAEAREVHPDSPALKNSYLAFLVKSERLEDAERLLREEIEREPENIQRRVALSNNLRAQGRDDEAEAVLEAMTEDFPIAAAWHVLGRSRLQRQDFAGAREALERAVELAPEDEPLKFLLAEAQVRDGDPEAARALVKTFERKPYQAFVEGLIAMEAEAFAEALDAFDEGLRNWPDNVGARYNAGLAARSLGDWERAINEFTEAARIDMSATRNTTDPFETEAALQLAYIFHQRANHRPALRWASVHLHHHPEDHRAKLLIATTLREQGSLVQARKLLVEMLDTPVESDARSELAQLEFDAGDVAAAWKLLDGAEPGDLRSLSIAVEREVDAGNVDAALARLDRAEASGAYEAVELVSLRGRVLYVSGETQRAGETFERALELDPDHAATIAGLATLRASHGQVDEAIEMFDRAAELEPENADHVYHAGQLLLQMGRTDAAEARLRTVARIDPGHAQARNDLAWLLSNDPSTLAEALRIGTEAYRLNDGSAYADTLGWIHYLRSEYPAAVDLLSRAAKGAPDDPTIRYHLGMALSRQGQNDRALEELKAAVGSRGFDEVEDAQMEIARLEGVDS